eukprot:93888-Pyramimonas_sp.AAC.1
MRGWLVGDREFQPSRRAEIRALAAVTRRPTTGSPQRCPRCASSPRASAVARGTRRSHPFRKRG